MDAAYGDDGLYVGSYVFCHECGAQGEEVGGHAYEDSDVDQLEAAGLPREQARVIVETQQAALAEAMTSQLATKADLLSLRNDMGLGFSRIEGEMKLTRWMLGILLGGVASLILKTFF